MMKFIICVCLCLSASAFGQFQQGDKTFSLSAVGASDKNVDDATIAGAFSVGVLLDRGAELGLRQTASYADEFSGSSAGYLDFNLNLDDSPFVPFFGISAGVSYGDSDGIFVGPEGGLKIFLNDTTFVQALIAYRFDAEESFSDGAFVYSVGVGLKW